MPRKSDLRLAGLGVDIVSVPRAEQFIKGRSPEALSRVLAPSELRCYKKNPSKFPFAKIFTAKEAFFKASQLPPGGVYAFSQLEVKLLPHAHFEIEWHPTDGAAMKVRARGCHFESEAHVGAELIYWKPSPPKT
ncbi:MAG: 4'-phosphopantetheinyl transferase superfamily protein [Candidatus Omnitrophica bacterium]|nr:4'-phosphopantetheinyl transferase superfamily protein [Candidatus Omnitrophota bacterium]